MQPVAVILDFDGVIVDSTALHLAAWAAAAQTVFRRELLEPDSLRGYATRTIAQILCRRFGDPSIAGVLIAAKEEWLADRYAQLPLLAGAADFIAALAARELPYGVASNSTGTFVRGALGHHGLAVPVVLTSSDVSRAKPAPDIFWACANALGIDRSQRSAVAVFEDSRHGLKAARDGGMLAIGVTSGESASALRAAGAVAVCAHLGEALAKGWLEQLPAG